MISTRQRLIGMVLILLFYFQNTLSKVLIMTHSYNRPEFIELHVKTFKAFLQDEYEYVVFNDAPGQNMCMQIEQMCNKLGVRCFRIPQNMHQSNAPGDRHIDGIQYSLHQLGFEYDGITAFIDSDMFLIKPFSIEKYLQGYDIAGDLQGRGDATTEVRYLSPVFVLMNMQTLPNKYTISFEGGCIQGFPCDVGAHTYYYFKNNPSIKGSFFNYVHIGTIQAEKKCTTCKDFTCAYCEQCLKDYNFGNEVIKFVQSCPNTNIEFFLDNTLLHYRGGSNWDGQSVEYHNRKTRALNDFMASILN